MILWSGGDWPFVLARLHFQTTSWECWLWFWVRFAEWKHWLAVAVSSGVRHDSQEKPVAAGKINWISNKPMKHCLVLLCPPCVLFYRHSVEEQQLQGLTLSNPTHLQLNLSTVYGDFSIDTFPDVLFNTGFDWNVCCCFSPKTWKVKERAPEPNQV